MLNVIITLSQNSLVCSECGVTAHVMYMKVINGDWHCYGCIAGTIAYAMDSKLEDFIESLYDFSPEFIQECYDRRQKILKQLEEDNNQKAYGKIR